jgi:ABC-type iron transport system FetAB ATPase subunit
VSNTPVAINPQQVTYVKEAPAQNGCIIYFNMDKPIHVKNDYLEVMTSIDNALA